MVHVKVGLVKKIELKIKATELKIGEIIMVFDFVTIMFTGLFTGFGVAFGQWFFQEYIKDHAKKHLDTVKELPNKIKDIGDEK